MIANIKIWGRWIPFAAPPVAADDPAISWLNLAGIKRHIPDVGPGRYPVTAGEFYGTLVVEDDGTIYLLDHTLGEAAGHSAA